MSTLKAAPVKLKKGINEVPVKIVIGDECIDGVVYVGGMFRKKTLPRQVFTRIYGAMEVAIGPGPYTINAVSSALTPHKDSRFPGKEILLYRALFASKEQMHDARATWKPQFDYRAIEGWYMMSHEGREWLNYHCLWIGDAEDE